MIDFKETIPLKFSQELDGDSQQDIQIYCDDQEDFLSYWSEKINGIDDLCSSNNFFKAIQIVDQLTVFLNDYFEEIVDEDFLLRCFENSKFVQFIPNFLFSDDNRTKSKILLFLICFSSLSGDFIDIIIHFIQNKDTFSYYLTSNKNTHTIISHFFTLIGLLSEYSEFFTQNLLNSNYIELILHLYKKSNNLIKIQILNFLSRMTSNASDIQFDNCKVFFKFLKKELIQYLIYSIKNTLNNYIEEKKLILLILDILQNLLQIRQICKLFEEANIFQLILDILIYLDESKENFIEIFFSITNILDIGFVSILLPINRKKILLLCSKIQYCLEYSTFLEKLHIIRNLNSMISKCEGIFIEIFQDFTDLLIFFVNADTDFRNEIIESLEKLGFTDIASLP